MRKLFTIASLVFAVVVSAQAQETANAEKEKNAVIEAGAPAQEKTEIKVEELPQAVQTTLKGDNYKGWEVVKAYVLKDKNQYEVELKNGAETKSLKLDAEGKVVTE